MTIEAEDVGPLLDEVERFARSRLAAAVERPEIPMSGAMLSALTGEARDLGLLAAGAEGGGFGLWAEVDGGPGMAVSLGALRALARADAGTAFAWHRLALAGFATARLGLAGGEPLAATATITGHHGLGRAAFAGWLAGRRPSDEDRVFLADWLDRTGHAAVVVAPADWTSLVWPVWSGEAVVWERVERADLVVAPQPDQHGFDGLCGFTVRRVHPAAPPAGPVDGAAARRFAATAVKLDLLGLLAIGAGALDHAASLARDYAHVRRQGGRLIADHPAVRLLLGEIDAARHGADLALATAIRPVDDLDLAAVVRSRLVTQEALCRGANQAVQVFGGIGYMRDTGVEKILRDMNMLRLQSGGLGDARLFAAHLDGGRA